MLTDAVSSVPPSLLSLARTLMVAGWFAWMLAISLLATGGG